MQRYEGVDLIKRCCRSGSHISVIVTSELLWYCEDLGRVCLSWRYEGVDLIKRCCRSGWHISVIVTIDSACSLCLPSRICVSCKAANVGFHILSVSVLMRPSPAFAKPCDTTKCPGKFQLSSLDEIPWLWMVFFSHFWLLSLDEIPWLWMVIFSHFWLLSLAQIPWLWMVFFSHF